MLEVDRLLSSVLSSRLFQADESAAPPIPYVLQKGRTRLVLVLGDNATGKSLVRRLVCRTAQEMGYEPINVSMAGRVQAGFQRLMIYGAESDESTGYNSARTVTMGVSTCQSRTRDHIVFWDEPDLGLSDGWAAGMGVALRAFALSMPERTMGAFVVTHSRALVRQLLAADPYYLGIGPGCPKTVMAWLRRKATPTGIEVLAERAYLLRSRVRQALMHDSAERSTKGQTNG